MRPDFVDVDQLVGRLGIDHATFRRLQQQGSAPDPDRHLDGNPLWWWDRVEHWSRQQRRRSRRNRPRTAVPTVDLVDIGAIARRLHVTHTVAERWRRHGALVEPDYRWSFGDVWLWSSVEAWARGRSRAHPVTPVPADPPPGAEAATAEDPPSLGGLDALMARLDEMEASLDERARPESDAAALESELLTRRMDDVAEFIDGIDG